MKKQLFNVKTVLASVLLTLTSSAFGQTNVFDDIIATSPNHNLLEAALIQEGLDAALQDPTATLTVFAPDDNAMSALASELGITDPQVDPTDLLATPDLDQILLYHVLGSTVASSGVTNGLIAAPLNTANTLKFTVDGANVYANQASITAVDLTADNGVVHVLDAVVLPNQTVADVAIGSAAHTSLVAAVVEARLLPALTDPFGTFTVFAPTNTAFDDAVVMMFSPLPVIPNDSVRKLISSEPVSPVTVIALPTAAVETAVTSPLPFTVTTGISVVEPNEPVLLLTVASVSAADTLELPSNPESVAVPSPVRLKSLAVAS